MIGFARTVTRHYRRARHESDSNGAAISMPDDLRERMRDIPGSDDNLKPFPLTRTPDTDSQGDQGPNMERIPGLLEHLKRRLGSPRRVESAQSDRGNRGYDLVFYEVEDPGIVTVVTNGLRFQRITAIRPEELVCSLRSDQERFVHYLVDSIASMIVENGRGMEYGSVFGGDRPIIDGTSITGVIAYTSPLFDAGFDFFPTADAATVQMISLVPVTEYEIDFVADEGADMLFEVFRLNGTDILDIGRESAV
ncbi:suppressor of fused domain protein [Nocardia yamanashiensis]|uniref:suppressor of fused domain protein n=1 Tax=Nocardia yamanashiensis TaxID=209247 RepID=UPI001E420259|nr:suppressor of fused domain protein [Nocardia yamanashiensis]UGT40989.1 suppressor of fused domain protein [Nocardia yamanashiensis]